MTIELKPGPYYLGLWFVGHDERLPVHKRVDWLCGVWRDHEGGPWVARYRIAFHASPGLRKHGAPADKRRWTEAIIDAALSEATVLEKIEDLATQLAAVNEVPVNSVLIQGDYLKAIAMLEAQGEGWFHTAPAP